MNGQTIGCSWRERILDCKVKKDVEKEMYTDGLNWISGLNNVHLLFDTRRFFFSVNDERR